MPDRYTSRIALVVDTEVDVGAVVKAAGQHGDIDRGAPVGDPAEAQEVHWGGRMQKAVIRRSPTTTPASVCCGPRPTSGTRASPRA